MTVREMLAAKAAAKGKAEAILNSVSTGNRKMTDAEQTDFDASVAEVARMDDLINKSNLVAGWNQAVKPVVASRQNPAVFAATEEYREAFYAFARRGNAAAPEFLAALNEGDGASGGYLVPVTLDNAIIAKAASQSAVRQLARVIQTSNDRDIVIQGTVADAAWTDSGTGTSYGNPRNLHETTPTFSKATLKAYKISALAKVDAELLYDSAFNLEAELANQFGLAFGKIEEAAFIAGNGTGQPTGITVGSPVGVHSASPSAITSDELINLFHSLNPAYRGNASWILNDSTALVIRKLKNSVTGDYLWQPGLQASVPDRLLGRPVYYSAAMPAATASNVSVVFGDINAAYTIADRVPRSFQRLVELYANTDQIGFKATQRVDGVVVNTEAVTALRQSS